jgi:hypothetical protein
LDTGKKCREYFDGEISRKETKGHHWLSSMIIEMQHVEIGCDSMSMITGQCICAVQWQALVLVMLQLEILLPDGCT